MALNSAYYKTIGDTVYYATCNRDLKTPDLWWTRPTSFGGLPNEDFITTRTRGSWEVHEYARGNLLRAADEQCRGRQKKSKDNALLLGWGFSSRLWGKVTANYPPAGRDRLESLTKYDHVSTGLNTYRQKKKNEGSSSREYENHAGDQYSEVASTRNKKHVKKSVMSFLTNDDEKRKKN